MEQEVVKSLEALVAEGKLQAVLFDIGQTLVDSQDAQADASPDRFAQAAYAALCKEVGTTPLITNEEFVQVWNETAAMHKKLKRATGTAPTMDTLILQVSTKLFGTEAPVAARAAAARAVADMKVEIAQPMAGAADALAILHSIPGLKLGIVSNASDPNKQRAVLEASGLDVSVFGKEAIVISADVGVSKPNPAIFAAAVERLQVVSSKVAMVGDMLFQDIFGARKAGLRSIWLPTKAQKPEENQEAAQKPDHQPDAKIESLLELPAALLRVFSAESAL
mmetsp:Transcript_59987/g.111273  ORF Transcript_59987/g.111273 Transcript_59987/m.111273 type:complete len:279 (-) Transcript_59987:25-861(-)